MPSAQGSPFCIVDNMLNLSVLIDVDPVMIHYYDEAIIHSLAV